MPVTVLFLLVFVWSVAGWSFMAPQQSLLIDLAPDRAPVILALHAAAIYVGAALGSALGGVVIAGRGVGALGLAAGICAVVALGNLWLGGRLASARTRMDKPVPSR
jgi:predicted MFS family arabinose efflux permease